MLPYKSSDARLAVGISIPAENVPITSKIRLLLMAICCARVARLAAKNNRKKLSRNPFIHLYICSFLSVLSRKVKNNILQSPLNKTFFYDYKRKNELFVLKKFYQHSNLSFFHPQKTKKHQKDKEHQILQKWYPLKLSTLHSPTKRASQPH